MEREAEGLAVLAAREGGKPLVDSRVEVARAIDGVRNCCELLRSEGGDVVPMNVNAASAGPHRLHPSASRSASSSRSALSTTR